MDEMDLSVQESVMKEVAKSLVTSANRVVVNNELIISRELLTLVSPIIRSALSSSPLLPGQQSHLIIPEIQTLTMVRLRDILQDWVCGGQVELDLYKDSKILSAISILGINMEKFGESSGSKKPRKSEKSQTQASTKNTESVSSFDSRNRNIITKSKGKTVHSVKQENFTNSTKLVRFNTSEYQNPNKGEGRSSALSDIQSGFSLPPNVARDFPKPVNNIQKPAVDASKSKDDTKARCVVPKVTSEGPLSNNTEIIAKAPVDKTVVGTVTKPKTSCGINYNLECHFPLPYDKSSICGRKVDNLVKLQEHIAGCHLMYKLKANYENQSLKCKKCGSTYKEARSYYLHMACKHGILDKLLKEEGLDVLPCPIAATNGSAMQKKLIAVKKEMTKENDGFFNQVDDEDSHRQKLLAEDDDDFMESRVTEKKVPIPSLDEILKKYKIPSSS